MIERGTDTMQGTETVTERGSDTTQGTETVTLRGIVIMRHSTYERHRGRSA